VGIVDVTREFPDHNAEGAFVLVDRRVGTRVPRNDYRRRPVLAVYRSRQAAEQAATRAPGDARWPGSTVVLFLPPGFPAWLGKRYETASSAGLM
jgi:hypothetical protein